MKLIIDWATIYLRSQRPLSKYHTRDWSINLMYYRKWDIFHTQLDQWLPII